MSWHGGNANGGRGNPPHPYQVSTHPAHQRQQRGDTYPPSSHPYSVPDRSSGPRAPQAPAYPGSYTDPRLVVRAQQPPSYEQFLQQYQTGSAPAVPAALPPPAPYAFIDAPAENQQRFATRKRKPTRFTGGNRSNRHDNEPSSSMTRTGTEIRCEHCGHGYASTHAHNEHLKSIATCRDNGPDGTSAPCTFSGCQRALKIHKATEHSPWRMLLKKPLETPEQISSYIEERRKRFPSKANVTKKAEDAEAAKERGDLLVDQSKLKNFFRLFGNQYGVSARDVRQQEERERRQHKRRKTEPASSSTPTAVVDGQGDMLGSLVQYGDSSGDEAGGDEAPLELASTAPNAATNNAATTAAEEESSKAADDERRPTPRSCKFWLRGDCRHGRRCKFLHDPQLKGAERKSATKRSADKKSSVRAPITLLEKLLEKELYTERSVLLQSIRYIIQNDYLTGSMPEEVLAVDDRLSSAHDADHVASASSVDGGNCSSSASSSDSDSDSDDSDSEAVSTSEESSDAESGTDERSDDDGDAAAVDSTAAS